MNLFANGREANIRSTIVMVEDVLLELGHFVNQCRVEPAPDEMRAWEVTCGSAVVRIVLIHRGEETHLRASSIVLTIDAGVDQSRLFRHLLGLNRSTLCSAAFALEGEHVQVVSERPTMDLDRSEVLDLIHRVEVYADTYDDQIVAEFGGTLGQR